jgi:hypothetical protein
MVQNFLDDPVFITELVPVSAGDSLTGRMKMIQQSGGLFSYTCEFVGVSGTKMTAENLPELSDCTETLEAYFVIGNDDYPATDRTAFTEIKLQTGGVPAQLNWTAAGAFPPTIVNGSASGGRVDIVYPT